jgi:DNA invertase Pin-like site-specific DNA recombinase
MPVRDRIHWASNATRSFAALAEFERELIRERTIARLAAAAARADETAVASRK